MGDFLIDFIDWFVNNKPYELLSLLGSVITARASVLSFFKKKSSNFFFILVICLTIAAIAYPFTVTLLSVEPITRLDIVIIAYCVCCFFCVAFMVLAKTSRDKTVYQAKLKYGLFYDGDMDIPDNFPVQKKCHSPTREG